MPLINGINFISDYPYERDIMSANTRAEISEGIAFSKEVPLVSKDRETLDRLVSAYLEYVFGPTTKD